MSNPSSVFTHRSEDLAVLRSHFADVCTGQPKALRLQAPFGGGKRALTNEFIRSVEADNVEPIIWQTQCLDQENGLQWLIRMYGSLIAQINNDVLHRGRIEMILNGQLPKQPARVQGWYREFIACLKEAKADADTGGLQLRLPKDNPMIALVEVIMGIAEKAPVIIDLQSPFAVYSVAPAQLIEALYTEAIERKAKLMIILHDQAESDITKNLFPNPLLDLYKRRDGDFGVFEIAPWTEKETAAYLSSQGLEADATRLTQIGLGRPGFIAEITKLLQQRDQLGQLADLQHMSDIVPLQVNQDEIDLPDEPTEEGQRHRATAEDAPRIVYLAALLGQAFPSNLVADMSGCDRDSIDDIFDALGDLVEEVQFSEPLSTWIYRFRHEAYRQGILQHNDDDDGHEMARRIGAFMERNLVPRGYSFITKTARVYAEHGATERASALRSVALNNDNPDVWSLSYDFMRYFDELQWPDSLRNTLYINLLERLIGAGKLQAAENIHQEACEWATEKDDRTLTGWLLFAGSRIDTRKRDYYRARDRAADAIKIYQALDLPLRAAEVYNHLANIELLDGKPEDALKQAEQAISCGQVKGEDGKTYVVAPIIAHAEQVRGLVARRNKDLTKAIEHFKKANEHAGQAGIAALALDSGLSLGEALLAAKNFENARDVLRQVTKIAMSLRNTVRERRSCELLAQAEGALKNFDAAIRLASRTLELSSQLSFEKSIPIDHYHLGVFQYRANQHADALENLKSAHEHIGRLGDHPVVKDIVFFKGLCLLQTGELEAAKETLQEGYNLAQEARDWHKSIGSLDSLAQIAKQQGDTDTARKHLTDALAIARKASLKKVRAEIRRKLEAL